MRKSVNEIYYRIGVLMNKGESIFINIGQTSALVHGNISDYKFPSTDLKNSKSIFIDDKRNINLLNYEETYDLDLDEDTFDIINQCQQTREETIYYEKIKFDKNNSFVPIFKPFKDNKFNIFDSIEYIDSVKFYEDFDESLRKTTEKLDYIDGFNLLTECHTSVAIGFLRIIENLNDEFPNKFKQIFGIWEGDLDYEILKQCKFLNSLIISESLKYPKTNFIPISLYKKQSNGKSYELDSLNILEDIDINFSTKDIKTRSRVYSYLIDSFRSIPKSNEFNFHDLIDSYSALWGSTGSVSGLSWHKLSPITKKAFYLDFIDKKALEKIDNYCFTHDFSADFPAEISHQIVVLNNHPELSLIESGNDKVLKHLMNNLNHFDCRNSTKISMLEFYLRKNYPTTLNLTSDYSNPFLECDSDTFYPSITRIYSGPSAAPLLDECSKNIGFYGKKIYSTSLKNFDFSSDSLEEHMNHLQQKIEIIDSEYGYRNDE